MASSDVPVPLQVLFTEVRSSAYVPMAFSVLVFTSLLVMWSLYEIPGSLWKHLISVACILVLLSMSFVKVHVSHAYKNMDMTRERISLILEPMEMFLLFQMTSLVAATVVLAILESTSGLDP